MNCIRLIRFPYCSYVNGRGFLFLFQTLNITEANETLETAKSLLTESDYLAVASYLVILGKLIVSLALYFDFYLFDLAHAYIIYTLSDQASC